jgi:FkbM family methyltransferase
MVPSTFKNFVAGQISKHFPRLWLESELRFRPNHFENEFWLVPVFCDRKKIAIDIGANAGKYSYYMSKYSMSVTAFEPNSDLWRHLHRVLRKRFKLESVALSGKCATAIMRIDDSNTGVSTIEESNDLPCVSDKSRVVSRVVEVKTLDSFSPSNISLIKIDVEGHEEAVLEGARNTIDRNRPVLIIESENRHNPGAPRRIAEMLSKLEYLGFYIKHGQLMAFDTLCDLDTDPENIESAERPYINNFIFIPAEQAHKVEKATLFLSTTSRSGKTARSSRSD